jgi:putative methionine-R-sulfoxide reductase with GAF domain
LDAGLLTWHLRWQGFLLRTKRDLVLESFTMQTTCLHVRASLTVNK